MSRYLDAVQQKGLIVRERGKVRAISLPRHPAGALPLLGRIGAGSLQEAIEDPELLNIGAILGKEGRAVLKVEDDSLIGLAIAAESFLVIDPDLRMAKGSRDDSTDRVIAGNHGGEDVGFRERRRQATE